MGPTMVAVVEAYQELAARILARPARLGPCRLVAVDGPSGAGKTVFATRLAGAVTAALAAADGASTADRAVVSDPALDRNVGPDPACDRDGVAVSAADCASVPVVRTDDLLDGWADQLTFWPRLQEWVLAPLRAGRPGRYRRYSWIRRRFTPGWITVPPAPVVILEGVSSARVAVEPELTLAVFVTAPSGLRLDRALARDGAVLRPYLDQWRRGEDTHFAADRTAVRADLLVDGAPTVPHDPATEYVRATVGQAP